MIFQTTKPSWVALLKYALPSTAVVVQHPGHIHVIDRERGHTYIIMSK
jgi:hypothetical protein